VYMDDNVKHVHFKYWPSQFKKHDNIVISLSKRHLWITWRHLLFKVQYRLQPPRAWMTATALRLIPPTGHHCVLEIIWSVISWYLSYHLSFQKNMGVLNFMFIELPVKWRLFKKLLLLIRWDS
jgi:hypothetical protein